MLDNKMENKAYMVLFLNPSPLTALLLLLLLNKKKEAAKFYFIVASNWASTTGAS